MPERWDIDAQDKLNRTFKFADLQQSATFLLRVIFILNLLPVEQQEGVTCTVGGRYVAIHINVKHGVLAQEHVDLVKSIQNVLSA